MAPFRPDLAPHVAEIPRHLPADLKRIVKSALRALATDPRAGEPLIRELEGFWKYRVKRFRIVYAIHTGRRTVRILAVGHRKRIYEQLVEEIHQAGKP